MPGLLLENLSKTFSSGRSRLLALDGLNLEVPAGDLLVVLGPSGCGKTTLLRLISGLEKVSSGEIILNGESLLHKRPQDRAIGMAFQYPALLPQLSVQGNISLGPKLRGVPQSESTERTRELAGLLGIGDLLLRAPDTLSGGQQQRVSLARALATRPQLLLLDEPLANLDPISRHELRDSIRAVQQKLCVTTVYVTHDQSEAAALADRIAILNQGALQQIGPAAELYTDPVNLFVARFFAPSRPNVLSGELTPEGFRPEDSQCLLPTIIRAHGKATCVIHARSIRPGGAMEATVIDVQHTGWSTHIRLNLAGLLLSVELPATPSVRPGAPYHFQLNPADLLFFDPSGARLR